MLCLKSQRDYKFKCILLDNRELSVSYKSEQKCEQMLIDIAKIIGLDEKKYFSFKYSNSEGQMVITHKLLLYIELPLNAL